MEYARSPEEENAQKDEKKCAFVDVIMVVLSGRLAEKSSEAEREREKGRKSDIIRSVYF